MSCARTGRLEAVRQSAAACRSRQACGGVGDRSVGLT